MPRKKIAVPTDVAREISRLQNRSLRLERERAAAENTLRDYVTDVYLAGDGSYDSIAQVLRTSKAWVAQLVTETLESRADSGDRATG